MSKHRRNTQAWPHLQIEDRRPELKGLLAQAESGSAIAWINLGWIYEHGAGVPMDFAEAERCYKEAVVVGDAIAKFHLAGFYESNKNYQNAFLLFVSAAEDGHLPSIYWTGALYLKGQGIVRDVQKSESYLRLAAEKGHIFARRDYYRGLALGIFGKRALVKGFIGWINAILDGAKLAMSTPDSELLQ